ncbi:MAG: ankyrin repeat domain-containing protein [Mariniblastus sp.]|nr:ankyrin repeat domain-containing protein [Mariniblastus sp.]
MKQVLTTIAAVLLVGCGPNIHEATWTGNIQLVKQHIDADVDVNAKNQKGETPLHIAAVFCHEEMVELLIANGADVHAGDEIGWTPLHHAAYSFTTGRRPAIIAERLMAADAEVNAKSKDGSTPLDVANNWGHEPAAACLRKHNGKTTDELKAEGS